MNISIFPIFPLSLTPNTHTYLIQLKISHTKNPQTIIPLIHPHTHHIVTHLTENALRRSHVATSCTMRCDRFWIFFSRLKSIVMARGNDWWHMISLSETDFTFCKTYVPPKREWRPGGGRIWYLAFSRLRAIISSCSSRCFSAALRCRDASARDSAVYKIHFQLEIYCHFGISTKQWHKIRCNI